MGFYGLFGGFFEEIGAILYCSLDVLRLELLYWLWCFTLGSIEWDSDSSSAKLKIFPKKY